MIRVMIRFLFISYKFEGFKNTPILQNILYDRFGYLALIRLLIL